MTARTLVFMVAVVVGLSGAHSLRGDEDPIDAGGKGPGKPDAGDRLDAHDWLRHRPANAKIYETGALERFRALVESSDWDRPSWNAQGCLQMVHVRSGLTFVLVRRGSFEMGSEDGDDSEKPVHRVALPAFLLCRTECTEKAWDRVEEDSPSASERGDLPVVNVTWARARRWCTARGLRLPTESEWEYACRAGSTGKWCFGSDGTKLEEYAWYDANSGRSRHPVGQKSPNAWGLFDMHGNASEWCEDTFHDSYDLAPVHGVAWVDESVLFLVHRGGSWERSAECARSAHRSAWIENARGGYAGNRGNGIGFRPAASLEIGGIGEHPRSVTIDCKQSIGTNPVPATVTIDRRGLTYRSRQMEHPRLIPWRALTEWTWSPRYKSLRIDFDHALMPEWKRGARRHNYLWFYMLSEVDGTQIIRRFRRYAASRERR